MSFLFYLDGVFDTFGDLGVFGLLVVVDDVHHLLLQVLAEDVKSHLERRTNEQHGPMTTTMAFKHFS